jgi:two-component system cell cycle sensor histidine kinase/response regulator CckA
MVADDEPALRHALVEILRSSGYTVWETQSAPEALDAALREIKKLDVLITDVVMPGLRGPELARRVIRVHPNVRVIYVSGYADGFSEKELPPNSAYLQKPFRFAMLLEQLRLMLQKA